MRFQLDEALHPDLGDAFRRRGHDVSPAHGPGDRGRTDAETVATCHAEGQILVALELDLSALRATPDADHPGLIVLRPRSAGRAALRAILDRVADRLETEPIAGRLWVVDGRRILIRRLGPGPG